MGTATRHSREFWKAACEKFERSGLSREAYARSAGLNPKTLRWWVAALKRDQGSAPSTTRFVPVEVAPGPATPSNDNNGETFEVVLSHGTIIRIPFTDASSVKDLLRAVVEAGC